MAVTVKPTQAAWRRVSAAVRAHEKQPRGSMGAIRKKIFAAPKTAITFKITGDASGGGKYYGRSFTGAIGTAATGNLAESDLGTLATADNLLIFNLQELGQSTHELTAGTPKVKYFTGHIKGKAEDGKTLVWFNGIDAGECA